jgi:hypothetical protein
MLLSAALLAAQASTSTLPPDYSQQGSWLCLPGKNDICSTPLKTTALNPNGYGSTGLSPVAKDAGIDCFYVYPTVSRDDGTNSDLNPGGGEEKAAVQVQFARFAGTCRTFAPIYRSMTVGLITAVAAGADFKTPFATAYGDVRSAWKEYITKYNKGRPFVLVGHSQGSWMLQTLIAQEIEGKPIARQMKLAIIPGFNVLVPQGKLVGGTFKSTPICSKPGQTGCVMTWTSYREKNAPPPGAVFGYSELPGMTVACTNPARPGATEWVPLDSYWFALSRQPVPGGPIEWSAEGPPPSPFLRTEGLVSARCVNEGPRGYLSIRTNADPKDKRTDRIGGEVGALGFFIPGWGMHLADMNAPLGDLIREVEEVSPPARTAPRSAR